MTLLACCALGALMGLLAGAAGEWMLRKIGRRL